MRATCDAPYNRSSHVVLHCTFPTGHSATSPDHSWFAIRCADLADADAAKVDYTPQAVQAYLDSMTRGEMDPYLEAILAVAHSRKRAIRGVPGFRAPTGGSGQARAR